MNQNIEVSQTRDFITFMFTDMEGSTELVKKCGDRFFDLLAEHFEILKTETEAQGGRQVVRHSDSYFAVFPDADGGLAAAASIQDKLAITDWPMEAKVRVRIGLHTGEAASVPDPNVGYVGYDVHRASRISQAAYGGQILLSSVTRGELSSTTESKLGAIRYLGSHRFKDLSFPENIYELNVPGSDAEFPPIRSMENRPIFLPRTKTTFVGRRSELAKVSEIITSSPARIVTLTGPGGAGKTRLSIEVAKMLSEHFVDGIFQIQLGGIADARLVCSAIAHTLHVPDYNGRLVIDDLKHFVGDRKILLIIDNFEQVIDAAQELAELADACEQLKLLVTSRAPLNITEEIEFQVSAMSVPRINETTTSIDSYDSVQLFLSRARAKQPGFFLDSNNAHSIARICRRLDGLPLALELAASRLHVLSVTELADLLDQSLSALGRAPRDVDSRHKTLRNAVLWSYQSLNDDECALFRKLSIFKGGFDMSAAQSVCLDSQNTKPDVVDLIDSLCEKNLIVALHGEGLSRFRMLEPIRQVAGEQLQEQNEFDYVADLHCKYFLELVKHNSDGIVGSNQRTSVTNIHQESDNVRAAIEHCITKNDIGGAAEYLKSLLWLWIPRGQFTEGQKWAEQALSALDKGQESRAVAVLCEVAAWLQMISGDYPGSLPRFERAHRLYGEAGNDHELARSMITFGITSAVASNGESGPEMIMEALGKCRELGDDFGAALALIAMGEGARAMGQLDVASDCYKEALTLMKEQDNQYWIGALLLNMAHTTLKQGDLEETQRYLDEVVSLASEYDYPMMINLYVALMGELSADRGDYKRAAQLFGAATSMVGELGVKFEPADQATLDEHIAITTEALGPADYKKCFEEGMDWPIGKALDVARTH
ncbi:MAG: adenylate/guanylate cyclase domain-containing protein [Pseudomonadota bacterium]